MPRQAFFFNQQILPFSAIKRFLLLKHLPPPPSRALVFFNAEDLYNRSLPPRLLHIFHSQSKFLKNFKQNMMRMKEIFETGEALLFQPPSKIENLAR